MYSFASSTLYLANTVPLLDSASPLTLYFHHVNWSTYSLVPTFHSLSHILLRLSEWRTQIASVYDLVSTLAYLHYNWILNNRILEVPGPVKYIPSNTLSRQIHYPIGIVRGCPGPKQNEWLFNPKA